MRRDELQNLMSRRARLRIDLDELVARKELVNERLDRMAKELSDLDCEIAAWKIMVQAGDREALEARPPTWIAMDLTPDENGNELSKSNETDGIDRQGNPPVSLVTLTRVATAE